MTEREFEKIKLKHIVNNLKIYNDNKELVTLYEDYIRKIAELFDFFGTKKNDLLYTVVFDILVDIGYFSCDNTFSADKEDFEELTIRPGISVVNGAAVCRNVACFYADVFKHLYSYPLTLCCYDEFGGGDKDTEIYGNHMINLTYYNGAIYGFDIMNHCLFKAVSNNKLKGFDIDYYLTYKEYGDLLIHLTTELDPSNNKFLLEPDFKKILLKASSKKEIIASEEYKKIIAKADDFITDRKKIFKSFLRDNMHYQEEIKQKMLSLK